MARGARRPDRRSGRNGNAQAQLGRWRTPLLLPPTSSKSVPVEHRRQVQRNPDASLYSGGCDSGASVRHARSGRDDCADSAGRPRACWPGVRPQNSHRRSRSGRGRNGGKRRPAPGNGRTRTDGLCPASAIPVNAETVSTGIMGRAILARHPCPVRVWGSTSE